MASSASQTREGNLSGLNLDWCERVRVWGGGSQNSAHKHDQT